MDRIIVSMKMFTFFANRNSDVKSMLQDHLERNLRGCEGRLTILRET